LVTNLQRYALHESVTAVTLQIVAMSGYLVCSRYLKELYNHESDFNGVGFQPTVNYE